MTMGHGRALLILVGLGALPGGALGGPLVDQAELENAGFRAHWTAQLPLAPGDTIDAGYIQDEVIYVTTDLGSLFAVTADSGLIRWAHALTDPDYTIYPPTHIITVDGTGAVVVPTAKETFVFDRFTGRQLRRYRPRHLAAGPVLAVDDLVLAGSNDSRFYATRVDLAHDTKPFPVWTVSTDGAVTSQPVLFDGDHVLFASRGGTVYACRADDKRLRFSKHVGGAILGDPALGAGGAFVASTDRSLYKLDTRRGDIIWRARFEAPLTTGPTVVGDVVLQMCERSGITALDAATGKVLWRVEDAREFVAHTKAGDVLLAANRDLLIVSHETGESLTTLATAGLRGVASNPIGDGVILLGTHGAITALRLGDVPYLKRQQIIAARTKLNQRPVQVKTSIIGKNPLRSDKPDESRSADPLRSKRDRG